MEATACTDSRKDGAVTMDAIVGTSSYCIKMAIVIIWRGGKLLHVVEQFS